MIKKTVTYKNYNGVEVTEDYYFNLNKAEVVEMQMTTEGGFAEKVDKIIKAQDTPTLINIFKDLVLKAYGVKSDDGRRFMKSEQIREEFTQTEAYSEIFMSLAFNADEASEFINGIMPADLKETLDKAAHPANK